MTNRQPDPGEYVPCPICEEWNHDPRPGGRRYCLKCEQTFTPKPPKSARQLAMTHGNVRHGG